MGGGRRFCGSCNRRGSGQIAALFEFAHRPTIEVRRLCDKALSAFDARLRTSDEASALRTLGEIRRWHLLIERTGFSNRRPLLPTAAS
jgi:hypothetical protein